MEGVLWVPKEEKEEEEEEEEGKEKQGLQIH
jgi:hypothetical protein